MCIIYYFVIRCIHEQTLMQNFVCALLDTNLSDLVGLFFIEEWKRQEKSMIMTMTVQSNRLPFVGRKSYGRNQGTK